MGEYIRAQLGRNCLGALGHDDLTGGYGLTDVALGVVGDVDEKSADGGGQVFFTDGSRLLQIGEGKYADTLGTLCQRRHKLSEQGFAVGALVHFLPHRC
jgi:hypothetical protein